MSTLQAIEVATPGGPEVLRLVERPLPEPAAGEVRVRNAACGVNFIDIYHRTGFYPQPLPFVPGLEGAGVVDAVGPGAARFKPGDRVAYPNASGAYAQQVCIPQDRLVPVPDGLGLDIAAAAMLQGLTAHSLTHSVYAIQPGDTVLIHAAAGGAGQMLVQMAKLRGARVIATVSTEAKAQIARERGADDDARVGDIGQRELDDPLRFRHFRHGPADPADRRHTLSEKESALFFQMPAGRLPYDFCNCSAHNSCTVLSVSDSMARAWAPSPRSSSVCLMRANRSHSGAPSQPVPACQSPRQVRILRTAGNCAAKDRT